MSGWRGLSEPDRKYNLEITKGYYESFRTGLVCLGSIRLCTIIFVTISQLISGRPGHERFYDYTNKLSYCSGPEEIMDISTKKIYTLTQETVRNPWDNLPYEIRTGKLVLKEKIYSKEKL